MEMMSLITWMLTIYWGLFFISDMPSMYNSTDSSVKEDDNGRKFNLKYILRGNANKILIIYLSI